MTLKNSAYIGGMNNFPSIPFNVLDPMLNAGANTAKAPILGLKDSILKEGLGSFAGKALKNPAAARKANIAGSLFMLTPGLLSTPLAILNVLKNTGKQLLR